MLPTKPYLLRAIYEWAEDNGFTPQVLVKANGPGVIVPREHVVDGHIVLNIGASAIKLHTMDNEFLRFSARFSGVEQHIELPIESISAIFARENAQGIFFESEEHGPGVVSSSDVPKRKPHSLTPSLKKTSTNKQSAAKKSAAKKSKKGSAKGDPSKPSHLKIIK